MAPKVAAKKETKTALLEVGMDLMLEKGYTNTGIQEILSALGVPKGSFYHYFDSKENFAVEIIRYADQGYSATMMRTLRNPKETPLQRMRSYAEQTKAKLLANECRKGCLIGNLSQEMSDQSECLRKELMKVVARGREMFAECIAEGQKSGEINKRWSPDVTAEFFLSGWNGAIMRSKTVKNTEPLDIFIDVMFEDFLKA